MATQRTRRFFGALWKYAARPALWLVAGLVLLVGLLALASRTDTARTWLATTLSRFLSELLVAELRIGKITELGTHIVVEDAEAWDGMGRPLARAARLSADVDLTALLRGDIVLEQVEADRPWVSLHAQGDSLAVAEAFLPARRSVSEPSSGGTLLFAIRQGTVRHGTVAAESMGLSAAAVEGSFALSVSQAFRMHVRSLTAHVARGQTGALELEVLRSSLNLEHGETSRLEATLSCSRAQGRASTQSCTDILGLTGDLTWGHGGISSARAKLVGRISPQGVKNVGEPAVAELLASSVEIDAHATLEAGGQKEALSSSLRTDAGELALELAREGRTYTARVRTAELVLARLLNYPGLDPTAFDLSATATERVDRSFDVTLAAQPARYGQLSLPAWQAGGRVGAESAQLASLAIPAWTGERDKLGVDVELHYAGDVRGNVDVQLARVNLGPVDGSVGGLSVRARVEGRLTQPTLDLQLEARELSVGASRLERLKLSIHGNPRQLSLRGAASAGALRARAAYDVELNEGEQVVRGSTDITGWLDRPLHVQVPELRVRSEVIELHDVRVVSGSTRLAVDGRYDPSADSDLRATLTKLSLAELVEHSGLAGQLALAGRADAVLALRGFRERPEVSATLRISDISVDGVAVGKLEFEALARRTGELTAQLALEDLAGDGLKAHLQGRMGRQGAPLGRLEAGSYTLGLEGRQDLRALAPLWRLAKLEAVPRGVVTLDGQLVGTLDRPEGALRIVARDLVLSQLPPLEAELGLELGPERTWAGLRVDGPGAGVRAAVVVDLARDLRALLRDPTLPALVATPGSVQVDLQVQRLDHLPAPFAVPMPVRLAAQSSLTMSREAPPRGQLSLQATWLERPERDLLVPSAGYAYPLLRLDATLQDSQLKANLSGELMGRPVLGASLAGRVPVRDWLRARHARGDLQLDLHVKDLELADLPRAPQQVSGRLQGDLWAERLLGENPQLDATARVADLRVAATAPHALALEAHARREGGELELALREGSRTALYIDASLPWSWVDDQPPVVDLEQFHGSARFSDMPLASLLTPVPGVAHAAGTLNGSVEARGLGDDFDVRGRLVLGQVALTTETPPLRFEKLDATVRFDPKALVLESLRCVDQSGLITATGDLTMERFVPSSARVTVQARNLPLRRDGLPVATFDGDIHADANLSSTPHAVRLTFRDVAVALPDQGARSAQKLEAHPDVIYTDDDVQVETAGELVQSTTSTPLELVVDASEPFWLRRSDFGMQLGAELRIMIDDQGTSVAGPVRIQRGFLNILGKGFELERGLIVFDGAREIDPTVTLAAVHKLAGGETVTAKVQGRLSAPTLSFTSSVPGVTTNAEALQLLVRGRNNTAAETAEAQVGAALAGLTAGLLSKLTRNRYGKYVPVLSLEAGASSGTRVRAGVEANDLIPDFIRPAVQGAYVEGYVGSENEGGSRQATGGVLVELYFPKNIVTGGTWEVPSNWALEVTWEP